jgi:ABC-2 type transport system permease protein
MSNKYTQTFKMFVKKAQTYWSIELVWVINAFLTPFLFIQIWKHNEASQIAGFSLPEMITYYIVLTTVSQIVTPHIDWNVINDINEGNLRFFLMKPYKYFLFKFIEEIPWKMAAWIINIFPLLLFSFIYKDFLYFPSFTVEKVLTIIVLFVCSYLLLFLMQFLLGCLAFWFTNVRSFARVFYMSNDVFAGRMFPLVFLPAILKTIGQYLPFQYLWYFPTLVILDKDELIDFRKAFVVMLTWIISLAVIVYITWKKGVKSYSSYGG